MPEFHIGFGVLPTERISWSTVVCKHLKKRYSAAGEVQSYSPVFHADVEACEECTSYSAESWRRLQLDGLWIGPLRVYKTTEEGVVVEFCGAWYDNACIDESTLKQCLKQLEALKREGRIPRDVEIGSYKCD